MTHELLLTSVIKGLEDSRSFCAVACDKNIPASLVKRLHSVSSYRHLFQPDSPDAQRNPVVYSHFIVHTLDTAWSVLSRIAPTGWDFEHNPNHLAHHIALTEDERSKEGPAFLLGLEGFHLTEWYTPPVRFDRGRSVPSLTAPAPLTRRQQIARERHWFDDMKMLLYTPSAETPESLAKRRRENEEQLYIKAPPSCPCPLWQEITGDAAWGGILAETVLTGQHAALIYNPGTNILPLFIEALSILPREHLWRATFTTFFTGLPEHIVCQWKGAVAGSKEAEELPQQTDILLIDLTKPHTAEPKGIYVGYARSGSDNLLPEPETENGSAENPDFDTKPFIIENKDDKDKDKAEKRDTFEAFSSEYETDEIITSPFALVQDNSIKQPKIIIRPRSEHSEGVFSSFLNMKSKTQFYILYTITFALLCFLFILVLDQYFHFGLFNKTNIAQQTAKEQNTENKTENKAENKTESKSNTQHIQDVQTKKSRSASEKENIEEQNDSEKKKQHAEITERIKKKTAEVKAETEKQETELYKVLSGSSETGFVMPLYLPLLPPSLQQATPEDVKIIPPKEPQVFPEFKPLFPYRAALQINFVPLLTLVETKIITEKQKFYADDKDGGISEDNTLEGVPPDEERIPDIYRAEWLVSSVSTGSSQATPLFFIKLTGDGLSIEWQRDGLTPQHFYNTLWISLGFLQCSAGRDNSVFNSFVQSGDNTAQFIGGQIPVIKSTQIFKPLETQPFYPNKQFDGLDKTEFMVSTPFAEEPWKTLWAESPAPPFSLILDAKILPNLENHPLPGIKAFKKDENAMPFRFFADIQTDVDYKRDNRKGTASEVQNTAFIPVDIPLEGTASPVKIIWTDRSKDRLKQLNEEKEAGNKTLEEKKKELDEVKQQILSEVSKLSKEDAAALRIKRNEIQTAVDELRTRSGEIDDMLKKLPEARKRAFDNSDLRIEYSLKMTRTDSREAALILLKTEIKPEQKFEPAEQKSAEPQQE